MTTETSDELLTELSNRMIAQLEAEGRRLSRSWMIFLLLVATFFAMGLAPYVVNRDVVLRILVSQEESVALEKKLRSQLSYLAEPRLRYESLAVKFRDASRALHDDLQIMLTANEIEHDEYARHAELIRVEVEKILRNPWPFSGRRPMPTEMHNELRRHFDDYYQWGAGDPKPWNDNRFGDASRGILDQNNYLWEGAAQITDDWINVVVQDIRSIERQLERIQEDRRLRIEEITGQSERLAEVERMTDLDTPAGDLPIPFSELILWFPLIVTAVFWGLWAKQGRWDRQHSSLLDLWRRRDPGGKVLNVDALREIGLGQIQSMAFVYAAGPVVAIMSAFIFFMHFNVFAELSQAGRFGVIEHFYTVLLVIALLGSSTALVVTAMRQRRVFHSTPRSADKKSENTES